MSKEDIMLQQAYIDIIEHKIEHIRDGMESLDIMSHISAVLTLGKLSDSLSEIREDYDYYKEYNKQQHNNKSIRCS